MVKVDGNKLTIAFEKAGEKKVVDSFVERVVGARTPDVPRTCQHRRS